MPVAWDDVSLNRGHADHGRAAVDHVKFSRRSTADVDDTATPIRTAVGDAYHDGLAVADVCNQHVRAERQRAMSGCKRRWAGYLAACGPSATIKRRHSVFGVNWTDHDRGQQQSERWFEDDHWLPTAVDLSGSLRAGVQPHRAGPQHPSTSPSAGLAARPAREPGPCDGSRAMESAVQYDNRRALRNYRSG